MSAVKLTVKLTRVAVVGQVKVTGPWADEPGLIIPKAAGVPDATVTAPDPATVVMAERPVIMVFVAVPRPLFVSFNVTTRVTPGVPSTLVPTAAARLGASGVKFATTFAGAFIVMLCGLALPVNAPEKFANR